jgi:hypothetical protein
MQSPICQYIRMFIILQFAKDSITILKAKISCAEVFLAYSIYVIRTSGHSEDHKKSAKEGTIVTSVKEGMDQQQHELIVSGKDTSDVHIFILFVELPQIKNVRISYNLTAYVFYAAQKARGKLK